MKVVVVESPAKAKTINKYLGSDYKVLASYGHVRDLPSKDGSVDPDNDFEMVWQADSKSATRIREIADATKEADKLILATDPDREGEAISWHLLEALQKRKALKDTPVERVVFNAITKNAVTNAMEHPREIDQELVDAYLARRALDYLVGFNLSPVLWRKLPGSRSAGRVQSVALRLICQRELEIETFVAQEYWSVEADLRATDGTDFKARLHALGGKNLKKFDLPDDKAATAALEAVKVGGYSVSSVESKPVKRNPPPPFITSTLQQAASTRMGFSRKPPASLALPPSAPCRPRRSSMRKAASPICGPMASTWPRKPITPRASRSKATMAPAICPRNPGAIPPRRRTRRKLTKPCARLISPSARRHIAAKET